MSTTIYKSCPKCSAEHIKSGIFCSRKCANSRGPRNEDFKEKVRFKLKGKPSAQKNIRNIRKVSRIESNCSICNTVIYIRSKELEKAKNRNTSITCKSDSCKKILRINGGKKSAEKRILRSKDEIKLYEYCFSAFKDSLSNHIIADGWDTDIVIPSLNLAISWQGPWHYKDMKMKNHSLLQVQNRDNIKRKLFTSLGWKVLEYKDCDYTPEKAFADILVEGRGYAPLP